MAKQPGISNLAARNACDEVTALVDESGGDNGRVRIYSGTQPAGGPDAPVTTQVLLAELQMAWPAFQAAEDATPGGIAVANAITDDSAANNTGTATWFRVVTKSGIAVIDGSVDNVDADMLVDSTSIVAGQTVQIIAFKYRVRET